MNGLSANLKMVHWAVSRSFAIRVTYYICLVVHVTRKNAMAKMMTVTVVSTRVVFLARISVVRAGAFVSMLKLSTATQTLPPRRGATLKMMIVMGKSTKAKGMFVIVVVLCHQIFVMLKITTVTG